MTNGPDAREIFEGPDSVWGEKLCKGLRSEGLGVPVMAGDNGDRRFDILRDRQPEKKDETIRIVEQKNNRLLGIVLPSGGVGEEFIFISACNEGGFVFKTEFDDVKEYFLQNNRPFIRHGEGSFRDYMNYLARNRHNGQSTKIILEEESPRYSEVVEQAVTQARIKQEEDKNRRGETRRTLFEKFFGGSG